MTVFSNNNSATRGLWGVTDFGGRYNNGTVFRLTDGRLSTLYNFTGGADGGFPTAITADKQGALYGTAGDTVFKIDPIAGTFTTIWSFSGTDGIGLGGPLFIDDSGAIYGTTAAGGLTNSSHPGCYSNGCGTVFKLTPPKPGQSAWTLTTLYFFTGNADGAIPAGPYFEGGVIADKSGALYGTTYTGGTFGSICDSFGCGVVFKLTPPASGQGPWTETVIWSFSGYGDGDAGNGPLLIDGKGAIYGTTQFGGFLPCPSYSFGYGCGVVFKLTPPARGETAWTETTLWSFTGLSDGQTPLAGLVADNKGGLYGTTLNGGFFDNGTCGDGCGVVFKIDGAGFAPGADEDATPQ
ncbi:MAG TPA: choice-of-anchor tandem repeat GloVer-containing protein [Stellaceae bacterium]|nr:choice-of-anchor tandem repeat GloVer-containing protein [Stellaceae bacterium]